MLGSNLEDTDLTNPGSVTGPSSPFHGLLTKSVISGEVKRIVDYCDGALRGVAPIISILKNLMCKKCSEKIGDEGGGYMVQIGQNAIAKLEYN